MQLVWDDFSRWFTTLRDSIDPSVRGIDTRTRRKDSRVIAEFASQGIHLFLVLSRGFVRTESVACVPDQKRNDDSSDYDHRDQPPGDFFL